MKKNAKNIVRLIIYAIALAAVLGISVKSGVAESVGSIFAGIHINYDIIVRMLVILFVVLIIENQYNVGDYIEVNGFRGKVTNIGIRTTSIEDAGGNTRMADHVTGAREL